MSEKLARYGSWTYRAAWMLEVSASLIGLATGIALGYQAFATNDDVTAMDLVLASAPFIMVALAELTKIPIATLLFTSSWVWKPVVLLFLVALAAITFETVSMGLERAVTLRQLTYEKLEKELDAKRLELKALIVEADALKTVDYLGPAQAQVDSVSRQAVEAHAQLQDRIDAIDSQLAANLTLPAEALLIKEQLKEAKDELTIMLQRQAEYLKEAVRQFESQRQSYLDRIESARQKGDVDSVKKAEDGLARLANPRPKIESEQKLERQPLEKRRTDLQARFDTLSAQAQPMSNSQSTLLHQSRDALVAQLQAIDAEWAKTQSAALDQVSAAQKSEALRSENLQANQRKQDDLNAAVGALEAERIPMARNDQVRRIAGRVFGQKPEDVSEDRAGLVALIWFGSLAGLAALAGPLTAVVALALQHAGTPPDDKASRLTRSLRRLVVSWRWKRKKSVMVPVEVQVPVEVEKRVEVPVETIVKEILYVPILTDDPDMVMGALKTDLPSEVSELVRTAAKRGRREGKTQHVAS